MTGKINQTDELTAHDQALSRIRGRDLTVQTIIDVGASDGRWSIMAKKHWPWARCHLIEAYTYWAEDLEYLSMNLPGFSYCLEAAGAKKGETYFFNSEEDPFGGAASNSFSDGYWKVRQTTIDDEIRDEPLIGPFLIKLDTHGYEREILKGASKALKETNLIVVEVYNFMELDKRFPSFCSYLECLGFRCIDIAAPLYRPHDQSLWQMDVFFVPNNRLEFDYHGYY